MDKEEIIAENERRLKAINTYYNPVTGEGSVGERKRVTIKDAPIPVMYLPEEMIKDNRFVRSLARIGMRSYLSRLSDSPSEKDMEILWEEFIKIRVVYDFEYWAYSFISIKDKRSPMDIPFKLNRAQRRVLGKLEALRKEGRPIKFILLKARQWGGSTLIQIYMLWIQLVHRRNWNSVICGDVESQSRNVRAMITKALSAYPEYLLGDKVRFLPFEGSNKNKIIQNTNCVVSIGSAQKPDTLRSGDISGAHLTEVGLWKPTEGKKPEDLVQSIVGSIYDTEYTFLGVESTAKGVGNFFHRSWLAAERGTNNLAPIFVPWFDIDIYSLDIDDYGVFIDSMDDYERVLWDLGATLEAINWYREKSKDMTEQWRMNSEYPSTPEEAFQSTGRRRFRMSDTLRMRKTCLYPSFVGEITASADNGKDATMRMRLEKDDKGSLYIWRMPDNDTPMWNRYVVSMDVGGISDEADYTDIVVFDRKWMIEGGVPEVVAEWHGHIDHDKGAWKAVQLCRLYGGERDTALLVIESNTLDTEGTEGNNFEFILDEIANHYDNLYCRTPADQIRQGAPARWGFHTNTSTKPMVISHQAKAIRDGLYIERSDDAVDEHDTFEIKPDGKTMGAVDGMHDDRVMARAIGVWVCYHTDLPTEVTGYSAPNRRKVISEATI